MLSTRTINIKPDRHFPLIVRIPLAIAPVALYLFGLSCIPLPVSLVASDLMTSALARLIVIGTVILGFLWLAGWFVGEFLSAAIFGL